MADRWALFDEVAELYDAMRPGYPASVYELIRRAIPPPARLLEIGAGTGQATIDLIRAGYSVTALEPGPSLAAALQRKAGGQARVIVARFEEWPLDPGCWDLMVAATSFHWLSPDSTIRIYQALRPGGWLAVFWNLHISLSSPRDTDSFWVRAEEIYARFGGELAQSEANPIRSEPPAFLDGLQTSGFSSLPVSRHPFEITYTTDEYLALLTTFSDHRALPDRVRFALFEALRTLIDSEFDGHVRKRYETAVYLASKPTTNLELRGALGRREQEFRRWGARR